MLKHMQLDPAPDDLADALWLALKMHRASQQTIRPAAESHRTIPQDSTDTQSETDDRPIAESESKAEDQRPANEGGSHLYPRTLPGTTGGMSGAGNPVRSPAAAALPGALAITRALRPLKRRVPSHIDTVFDEQATVRFIAEQRIWSAIVRPSSVRWLAVDLVVDQGASMGIWQQTISELRRLLAYHGAFTDVRVWILRTDASDTPITLHAEATTRTHHPRELLDPSGRRLILMVSDCVAPAWRNGAVAELIRLWGSSNLVTLVQVLPRRLWVGTALGDAITGTIQSGGAGVPNSRLAFQTSLPDPGSQATGIVVPVVTLEPEPLVAWARVVAGTGRAATTAVRLSIPPQPPYLPEQYRMPAELSAEARLKRFRSIASPQARTLAGYLAAAPLTLPVMRLVQQAMLPASRQVHLAEVFLGGLLKRVTPVDAVTHPDRIEYDFIDDHLRDLLLNTVLVPDAIDVLRQVSAFVERRAGQSLDFEAILENPDAASDLVITDQARLFARVAARVIARLGGKYIRASQHLIEKIISTSSAPSSLNSESSSQLEASKDALADRSVTQTEEQVDLARDSLNEKQWAAEMSELWSRVSNGDHASLLLLAKLPETPTVPLHLRMKAAKLMGNNDPRLLNVLTGNSLIGNYWCQIEAGPFWYGEYPKKIQQVTLPYQYSIGRYPVTNAEFAQFLKDGGYAERCWWTEQGWRYKESGNWIQPRYWHHTKWNAPTQPVAGASWYEATAYCGWLTAVGHRMGWLPQDAEIRLPMSLEWERAARHTNQRTYPWGDDPITSEHANYGNTYKCTTPVGCFPAGAAVCGAHDMSGNVWEWTATPYKQPDQVAVEKDFIPGTWVVVRGGAWYNGILEQKCSFQLWDGPDYRFNVQGFRVVWCLRSSNRTGVP